MTLHDYRQFYKDDYNHSARLKEVFGTFQYQGVDYPNPNGINIEFKESHQYHIPDNRIRFACYHKDKLESDYMVFGFKENWYVHKTRHILRKYHFANSKGIAQPYLTTVRRNWLFKTTDLYILKRFLDDLIET